MLELPRPSKEDGLRILSPLRSLLSNVLPSKFMTAVIRGYDTYLKTNRHKNGYEHAIQYAGNIKTEEKRPFCMLSIHCYGLYSVLSERVRMTQKFDWIGILNQITLN